MRTSCGVISLPVRNRPSSRCSSSNRTVTREFAGADRSTRTSCSIPQLTHAPFPIIFKSFLERSSSSYFFKDLVKNLFSCLKVYLERCLRGILKPRIPVSGEENREGLVNQRILNLCDAEKDPSSNIADIPNILKMLLNF